MQQNRIIFLGLLLVVVLLGGCAQLVGGYKTSIRVYNSGELQLENVKLTSESGFDHRFGYLPPGIHKVYGAPIPSSPRSLFTLTWTESASGIRHEKCLDVPELVSRTYAKTLVFEIDKNAEVQVFTEKYR